MLKTIAFLKNYLSEQRIYHQRALITVVIMAVLMVGLLLRLAYLQIIQYDKYQTLSQKNRIGLQAIEPKRGLIYDRNGVLLAENIPTYNVEITPIYVNDLSETLDEIKTLITLSEDDIENFMKLYRQSPSRQSIPLKTRLNETEVANVAINQFKLPGVEVKARLIRHYPFKEAMAPVLGYVGKINAQELERTIPGSYLSNDHIGKIGIEKFYEEILRGKLGLHSVENDATGRTIRTVAEKAPISGSNIYLSIDSALQLAAYEALGDVAGSVVAIVPDTGEVLALVSKPSYDPNLFVTGISHKQYQALQNAPNTPLYNRAVRGQYPAASTVKPFLALAALENGVINKRFSIMDHGYFKLKNSEYEFRNWRRSGHGRVDLQRSIVVSNDTFYYNLADMAGIENISQAYFRYGFGQATHIDLPQESIGVVPTPTWKLTTLGEKWFEGDTINTGIGQGYMLTTPLQLANAIATFSAQGKRFVPTLLLKMEKGGEVHDTPSVIITNEHLDPEHWELIVEAMTEVITGFYGTGKRFGRDPPYSVAAKTGTAQVYSLQGEDPRNLRDTPEHLRDHSIFVAFSPVENPEIALAVVAEHSPLAPVIARKVFDRYWENRPKTQRIVTAGYTPDSLDEGENNDI